jgi:hypothetical protein
MITFLQNNPSVNGLWNTNRKIYTTTVKHVTKKCNHSPVEYIDIPIENFRNWELTQWGMSKYTDQGL